MFKFSKLFISLLGIGFIPLASGTFGSFFAIIFFYIILDYTSVLTLILFFIICFFVSLKFIKIYSFDKEIYDSSEIVIDEFLGIFLIIIFYDYIKFTNDLLMFLLIFILFRFFDIVKIYPANWIDINLKNSLGVVLDDLVAGVYCVLTFLLVNVFI